MGSVYAMDASWFDHGLLVTIAGPQMSPVVLDLDTSAWATLTPCRIDDHLVCATVGDCRAEDSNGYWGELQIAPDATEARLALVLDGEVHRCTVRRPAPSAPAPLPQPKRRRLRKGEG
jgi:hypothetical protein